MKKIKKLLLIASAIMCVVFFLKTERSYAETDPNYLTFTALANNSSVTFNWSSGENVQYKLNADNWADYTAGTKLYLSLDDKVSFKGKNVCTNEINHFAMNGKIAASGSVTSLTDEIGSDSEVALQEYCYKSMFVDCRDLYEAPELPATTMAPNCYRNMFANCRALVEAPELPSTTLAAGCYMNMFAGCSALEKAPVLPANIMFDSCYYTMFRACSSLKEAPELSAMTLAAGCYGEMFRDCTSLTVAPKLPATTLANGCYNSMFINCSHLLISTEIISEKYITTELTLPESSKSNCYKDMFSGAGTESGIAAEKLPEATPTAGTYYIYTNEFNIQYNLDGGTNAASNPSSYKFGTGVASFANPTKAGYKFDGWYTDAGFTKKITSIAKDVRGDYTLYAKWIKEKVSNSITVKDFFKDYSAKAQKIKLGAKVKGGAKLTYKSNNKKIKVDNKGTVTIPKNFCGIVKITITSAETDDYLKATATSTITVTSAKPKITKVSASKKALTLKWGKVKNADGYEITYSTDKNFAKAKKITAKKTATSTTIKKLTSKKKYYVKMRSYKKSGGKKIYSQYCTVKSIKVK